MPSLGHHILKHAVLFHKSKILITRADKGNIMVALDKDYYFNKIRSMLQDINTYTIINKNPIKRISSRLKDMLNRWKQVKYINEITYRSLNCNDGLLPRAYGLPKIHKPDCLFRIIVSSLDSSLYNLATFLHKILIKDIPATDSHLNNSFDLVQKLKDIQIDDYILISLDVISLFTNIPIDLAIREHIQELLAAIR